MPVNVVQDEARNGNEASASGVNRAIVVTAPIPDTFFTGRISVTSSDDLENDISDGNHVGTVVRVRVSPVGGRAGCSSSSTVSLTLLADGSASKNDVRLVNSPAGGAACSYTVSFPSSVRSETNKRVRLVGQGSRTATLSPSVTTATRAYEAAEIVDPPVVFAVSVAPASSVDEGEELVFGVSVPVPATQSVEVSYDVSGTAAGDAAGSGSVTIAAGQSSTEISIPTSSDDLDGDNQTVRVTLTSATNASIDPQGSTAIGTVKDDDPSPLVSLAEASVNIDRLSLTLELSEHSARDVKVRYSTTVGNGIAVIDAGQLTTSPFVVFGADRLAPGGSLRVRLVSAQHATINVTARELLVRDPGHTWQFHITSRSGVTPRQIAAELGFESGWQLFSWRNSSQRWVTHSAASGSSTALAAGTTVVFRGGAPSEVMLEAAGLGRSPSITLNPGWNIFTPSAQALGLTRDDFTTTDAGGSAVLFDPQLVDCGDDKAGVLVIYTYDQSDPNAVNGFRIALPCHPELQAKFDIPAITSIDERDTIYAYFHSLTSAELTFTNGQYSPA